MTCPLPLAQHARGSVSQTDKFNGFSLPQAQKEERFFQLALLHGELVVTQPMPNMPVKFWNDPGDKRYIDAYFSTYLGVWRHGDWVRITPRGSAVIYGRSDSTINRGGIRIGTAEVYDPIANSWSPSGAMVTTRQFFVLSALADGRILLEGGAPNLPGLPEFYR